MRQTDRPDTPQVWSVGRRTWTTRQIGAVVLHLKPVLTSLLGELRESGLARENHTAPQVVKQIGDDLTRQVNRQAGQMQHGKHMRPVTLQQTTIRHSEPTWC